MSGKLSVQVVGIDRRPPTLGGPEYREPVRIPPDGGLAGMPDEFGVAPMEIVADPESRRRGKKDTLVGGHPARAALEAVPFDPPFYAVLPVFGRHAEGFGKRRGQGIPFSGYFQGFDFHDVHSLRPIVSDIPGVVKRSERAPGPQRTEKAKNAVAAFSGGITGNYSHRVKTYPFEGFLKAFERVFGGFRAMSVTPIFPDSTVFAGGA